MKTFRFLALLAVWALAVPFARAQSEDSLDTEEPPRGLATTLEQIRQTNRPDTITEIELVNRDLTFKSKEPVIDTVDGNLVMRAGSGGGEWINNGWLEIPAEIARCVNAKHIVITKHRISAVPAWLTAMPALERLDLSGNPLNVRLIRFSRNEHLRSLNLASCGLGNVPRQLRRNRALQGVVLNNNRFTAFPKRLCRLRNLETMGFYGNRLSALPRSFRRFKSLKVIDLYHNKFKVFPDVLCQLPSQQVLAFSYNQLEQIPENIGNLTNLTEVYLRGNRLTTLPESMQQLGKTKLLFVSENAFAAVPPVIFQMRNLEELDVSANQMKKLAPQVAQLSRLKLLYVSSNPFAYPDYREYAQLVSSMKNRGVQVVE
ncbi:MAG: hypothetical protein MUD08_14540 [Cytophagales bacterium]|nr:hypothetical protein [Cytophagales bacterium]